MSIDSTFLVLGVLQLLADVGGLIPGLNVPSALLGIGASIVLGDAAGAALSGLALVPFGGFAKAGGRVLLDTNAVIRFQDALKLINSGEKPFVTRQTLMELQDLVTRGELDGLPSVARRLPIFEESVDVTTQARLRRAISDFTLMNNPKIVSYSSIKGLDGDAIIGTTGLLSGTPVITFDKAFYNALVKLGGIGAARISP
ncbi:PIN domain-containing protein [Gloeobacter violaceus]|uniref:PIN domain-containing protein n=1 Tax=Gloeobacter violaceus TaxID=33072 RepID=UPI0013E8AD97|nr:PIN domain-containing protein [Gloeobacter violaceus]